MCGFAGILRMPGGTHRSHADLVRTMSQSVRHRGPDDDGLWTDDLLSLGHRRLAVVDLSACGAQPMLSRDERWVLAYNGEAYNTTELASRLTATGHRLRGHSDTEVIVEFIARWGIAELLSDLEGMFAFALWDRERQKLTLARDRFGEKPLYVGRAGGDLVFASEMQALRCHPGFDDSVDPAALAAYLRHGYVPGPATIHPGATRLEPGTYASYDATDGTAAQTTYWSAEDLARQRRNQDLSFGEAVDALDDHLRRAVSARMVADVPLGAFLSGGIDSSAVVAAMQAASSVPVRTFTIGVADRGYDEAGFAQTVASHLGTDHTEHYVTPEEALALVPNLHTMFDEPFADSSQLPTLLVSRLARRSVTVALTGDGGDELFGGYTRHRLHGQLWRYARRVPRPLRRFAAGALGVAPHPVRAGLHSVMARRGAARPAEQLDKLVAVIGLAGPVEMYRRLTALWPEPHLLLAGGVVNRPSLQPVPERLLAAEPTRALMYLDTVGYLPNDILTKVDRTSMSVSLEARVPFLDRRLAEFAWSLPTEYLVGPDSGKLVLRGVLARYLPVATFERPKMGFAVPIGSWLRGPLRAWAQDLLAPDALARDGLLDPGSVRAAWQRFLEGTDDRAEPMWAVVAYQAWREGLGG